MRSQQNLRDGIQRVGDLLIACALVALTLPLMAIVALAIKLESPGPVLSRTERWDAGGRRFHVIKFRTETQVVERLWGRPPRLTRVGLFLRWTRIDDLPTLFNVLHGDLTIVGTGRPRPDFID
jgi:lipopolysaccharide/colanic/teichoic acid biosynthesis glycosyltransferase